jgi:hypothetical protein
MVAYKTVGVPVQRSNSKSLSHELFHDLTPQQLDREARSLADAEALTPAVRARLEAQLIERLKTPVDPPSWGPDWVKKGDRHAPKHRRQGRFNLLALMGAKKKEADAGDSEPLSREEQDDAHVIVRNLEKSRQVHHYRPLYIAAILLALGIAGLAMFVDYNIIRGDVWTRALSNEFMQVPDSLQSSVVFKSLQVVFAVLIVHFMLKITGVYGRNSLIVAAFVLAIVMIGSLGYLVAYNNMAGATSATLDQQDQNGNTTHDNSIDKLFANDKSSGSAQAIPATDRTASSDEVSLGLPKPSKNSLANVDTWVWLAFASVIFFIVTTVAALYMQTVENNVRNVIIARDYKHRRRNFAQLHLLELADRRQGTRSEAQQAQRA